RRTSVPPSVWGLCDAPKQAHRKTRLTASAICLICAPGPRRGTLALHLGDDIVGEPPPFAQLGGQWLVVLANRARPAEADDDVGNPMFLQPPHAVHGVGVQRDHMHL